ncbi:YciI family protein [uncultured Mycobacterium sp.]|uniref:YciI family protein n=1 Tax=uncultured Mycobacterium sp. TaxID=171292 RepID=UPI0035CA46EC
MSRRYWLIRSKPQPGIAAEQITAARESHVRWLLELERAGVVFLSGPLRSGPNVTTGSGVTVLRASTVDEARDIAAQDPFVQAGLRTFEVFEWVLQEGSFCVHIGLGEGSCQWL